VSCCFDTENSQYVGGIMMITTVSNKSPRKTIFIHLLISGLMLLSVTACLGPSYNLSKLENVPALILSGEVLNAIDAAKTIGDENIFAVNEDVIDYAERFVSLDMPPRQRAILLHETLVSRGLLGIEYMPTMTLTAQGVYDKRSANCVGFANLYIALARHFGLKANYQLVTTQPRWSMLNQSLSLNLHVNVTVKLAGNRSITIDINPLTDSVVEHSDTISDELAVALYYNNLAMDNMSVGDLRQAYQYATKAIVLAPREDMLWSNVGAILRLNSQFSAAEYAYMTALEIDSRSYTAMNNLAVLYQRLGLSSEANYYREKALRHRLKNPHFHHFLAQRAAHSGNYDQAIMFVKQAIELKKDTSEFYYTLSQFYYEQQRYKMSQCQLEKALEHSTNTYENELYKQHQNLLNKKLIRG
jgi:tetratricopeptide (TPR) repeat protein